MISSAVMRSHRREHAVSLVRVRPSATICLQLLIAFSVPLFRPCLVRWRNTESSCPQALARTGRRATCLLCSHAQPKAAQDEGGYRVRLIRAASEEMQSKFCSYRWARSPKDRWQLSRQLARQLECEGWAYTPNFGLSETLLSRVHRELPLADSLMLPGMSDSSDADYRKDRILFLDDRDVNVVGLLPSLSRLSQTLRVVVSQIARELRYSMFSVSGLYLTGNCDPMLACYSPGGYYRPHVDTNGTDSRILTAIYYLNKDWDPSRGGALRLHGDGTNVDIVPKEDSLVLFRADEILHEVTPTLEQRHALSIWFRGGSKMSSAG
eukprot:TRINITY_DN46114_c0_g1_i1.p1 TRINITY_DN46114_c0_g1~~TRINITY_DN46114_c0_g1_i1.p1  ORF type:complete len:323 (+),score=28.62 TRINITY_DN46114_c0_g1_i1:60-1028(+)